MGQANTWEWTWHSGERAGSTEQMFVGFGEDGMYTDDYHKSVLILAVDNQGCIMTGAGPLYPHEDPGALLPVFAKH